MKTNGECTLTKMSKEPDKAPNADGSWGIGMYSTKEVFDGQCDGYGFYRPKNPNHFFPDYESCEPWEIENHKLACELYNATEPEGEMKNIKEALDAYRKEIYHIDRQPAAIFDENDRDDIMRSIGFQDCVDLLLPLVEAHIQNAEQDYRGNRESASVRSFQALSDLKAKIGVE